MDKFLNIWVALELLYAILSAYNKKYDVANYNLLFIIVIILLNYKNTK